MEWKNDVERDDNRTERIHDVNEQVYTRSAGTRDTLTVMGWISIFLLPIVR